MLPWESGDEPGDEGTSDEEPLLFWAPASFARGFCALSDVTEIEYFCTAPYDAAHEAGIRWDDPALAIPWPVEDPQLSDRDAAAPTLEGAAQARLLPDHAECGQWYARLRSPST